MELSPLNLFCLVEFAENKFELFSNSFSSFIALRFQELNFANAKEYQRHIQDLVKHLRWSLCKVS